MGSFGPSSIAVDYSNSSTIYVANSGGPYKSTDGGSTWNASNTGVPSTPSNLAMDPQNPATLYLIAGSTVYKTTNAGASWSSLFYGINSLVIDPSNPRVLYGASSASFGRGVRKSTDAGQTWLPVWAGADKVGVLGLAISSSNPAILLAALRFTTDAFVTQLNPAGQPLFSSYLGGEQGEQAWGVAANGTGIYVSGDTYSERFATANAYQSNKNADQTAFVAKISSGGAAPGKATLVSPTGTISTASPTYTWNAVSTASWYLLYVSDSTTQGKINQWYKAADAECGSGTGTCSATPSTSLAGGSCQWWIQTYNDYGYGPWSDAMSFSVNVGGPPPKATLVAPSGNISTASPTYTWNAVSTSSWYLLYVNDSKTQAKINQWYKAADAGCGTGTGTCSATPSTSLASGSCQWWIQTYNDYGYGPWSDGMSFTVGTGLPGKATLVSPTGTISAPTPTYTWNAVTGSTWYLLWVNDSASSGKVNKWYTAEQGGCGSGTGNCSVTPDTVLANGAAQWWIQTWNAGGYGPWSDAMSFTVGGTIVGPYNIAFMSISAGEFQMGSNNGLADEKPVHRVILSKSFQLGKYEITQGQWKAVMGGNPSSFTEDDSLPVEQVSWSDVQQFAAKLNALNDGYQYRLPTEAEWEYACRAGTTGDYAGNLDELAWYSSNSGNKTHAVGTKKPNAWGLYDMHGNVVEWIEDWYSDQYYAVSPLTDPPGPSSGLGRVLRGGGWSDSAANSRSAFRDYSSPGGVNSNRGFRLLRTAQ
jgi:hypothetical protein